MPICLNDFLRLQDTPASQILTRFPKSLFSYYQLLLKLDDF